jgi:hypothetical protein
MLDKPATISEHALSLVAGGGGRRLCKRNEGGDAWVPIIWTPEGGQGFQNPNTCAAYARQFLRPGS